MSDCPNPDCVRDPAELDLRRRTVTLGGPPPPYDLTWANKAQPGALLPEYAALAADSGHSSKETTRV